MVTNMAKMVAKHGHGKHGKLRHFAKEVKMVSLSLLRPPPSAPTPGIVSRAFDGPGISQAAFSGHVKNWWPCGPVAFCMSQAYAITVFMFLDTQGHAGPVWPRIWPCARLTRSI